MLSTDILGDRVAAATYDKKVEKSLFQKYERHHPPTGCDAGQARGSPQVQLLQSPLKARSCCQVVRTPGNINKSFSSCKILKHSTFKQVWSLSEDQTLVIYDRAAGKKLKKVLYSILGLFA